MPGTQNQQLRTQVEDRLRKLRNDFMRAQMMPDMKEGSLKNLARIRQRIDECEREYAELLGPRV